MNTQHHTWTLRYPRSAREAYGSDIQFQHEPRASHKLAAVAILLGVFLLGWLIGGAQP